MSGVIHCHSTYSDGNSTFAEVCRDADRVGLDYLLMTDHDNMDARKDHGEKYWGRTLVLIGVEITPRWNHYLAYGIDDFPSFHLPPREYVKAVADRGGIGFCAHPFEYGSRVLRMNEYSWKAWDAEHYTGLEIWNYFSSWVGGCSSWPRAIRGALLADWQHVAGDPDPRTLAMWDDLGRRRRVVGIGGVDGHGARRKVVGPLHVTLHPYTRAFRTVRTHLLLDEPFNGDVDHDRAQLAAALTAGRAYIVNWERGDPAGFRFIAFTPDGSLEMGEEAPHPGVAGTVHFSVAARRETPHGQVRLLKDGQVVAETRDTDLQVADSGPGVYRVEVLRRGRGWIYSNPIYLR